MKSQTKKYSAEYKLGIQNNSMTNPQRLNFSGLKNLILILDLGYKKWKRFKIKKSFR